MRSESRRGRGKIKGSEPPRASRRLGRDHDSAVPSVQTPTADRSPASLRHRRRADRRVLRHAARLREPRDAQGRTIDLKIVLLPALGADAQPDPLFFLAGGPGQGAAQMGRGRCASCSAASQANRDIVLVDQRGTGKSQPARLQAGRRLAAGADRVGRGRRSSACAKCLAGYDADPRLYTTTIAMDDLDDVRAHLGYDRINLYGGSYGTRAALVYLRQHDDRVRSVVLDGVAPPDMRLPLFMARDAQRALDKLLADCAADRRCAELRIRSSTTRTRALLERLEREPSTRRG